MTKENRSIEALLAAGRPMTGISETTSILLRLHEPEEAANPFQDPNDTSSGQSTETPADPEQSSKEISAATSDLVEMLPVDPAAGRPIDEIPSPESDIRETPVGSRADIEYRTTATTTPKDVPSRPTGSIESAADLLPAEREVLRSGTRRDDLPVRDVTYETPSVVYFAFGRLKNDLARHTQRRITSPALIEAAFQCVPSDITALEEALASRDIAQALRVGTQRRISVRVSEERYRWLRDLTYLLYERSGERVAGALVLTLAIQMLLEAAGRDPS